MAASISSSQVIPLLFVYAPQFYTTDPTQLAYYNTLYSALTCQVNAQFLSCCGPSVFAFLMAHYLTIANNPTIGMLSNIHEGALSLGYNVSADMDALLLTPYGRSYLDLVKRTTVGSTVSNLPPILGGVISNVPLTMGCSCGGGFGNGAPGGCGCC